MKSLEFLTTMVFANLVVHIEVHGDGFNSTNEKEGACFAIIKGLQWVEVSVYPLEQMKGEGSVNRGENAACDLRCDFHNQNRKREGIGKCYVRGDAVPRWQAKALKALTLRRSEQVRHLRDKGYILRLTRWGDISRLNNEGLAYILRLIAHSAETRAYSNIWRYEREYLAQGDFDRWAMLQTLKAHCQASVSKVEDALEASRLGWKVYAGARQAEIRQALINAGEKPVYRCPYDPQRKPALRCSTCPIPCNGERHTLAPLT